MRASRDQGSPADAEQACLCNARESSRLGAPALHETGMAWGGRRARMTGVREGARPGCSGSVLCSEKTGAVVEHVRWGAPANSTQSRSDRLVLPPSASPHRTLNLRDKQPAVMVACLLLG
jgi:hypothetical protein